MISVMRGMESYAWNLSVNVNGPTSQGHEKVQTTSKTIDK